MMNRIRILILTVLILLVSCIGVTVVFAGTGSNASASVYVTISNDSDFVQGTDGTVMAHVPFTVEYFDLAEYGLEDYYRLDDDDELIEQPTVLHLLIRVLERYYAMRTLDREGDMHSDVIDVTGAAKSLWLDKFWGHDGNLMYFVNHMYPLMSAKWGATADYILLNDGDDVDLAMYTDWSFYNNSAFLYFDQSTVSAKTGRSFELQLLAKPTAVVNDGVDRDSIPMQNETIRISSDRGITWSRLEEKTDADGMISLSFDSPETYYVATGPNHTNYNDAAPAICVIDVSSESTADEILKEAKRDAINQLRNYKSSDLYRAAEQANLSFLVEEGEAAINAAKTEDEVAFLLAEYLEKLDHLKTDEQYAKEEQKAERKARAAAIKKTRTAKTTIKVTALKKHRANVTWKKVTLSYAVDDKRYSLPVSGYKIYRTTKKNGKYKLIKTVKKAGTLKYTDRKLKKGKKYFYKVRTYTVIGGETYLGKWSKAKSVRAK